MATCPHPPTTQIVKLVYFLDSDGNFEILSKKMYLLEVIEPDFLLFWQTAFLSCVFLAFQPQKSTWVWWWEILVCVYIYIYFPRSLIKTFSTLFRFQKWVFSKILHTFCVLTIRPYGFIVLFLRTVSQQKTLPITCF